MPTGQECLSGNFVSFGFLSAPGDAALIGTRPRLLASLRHRFATTAKSVWYSKGDLAPGCQRKRLILLHRHSPAGVANSFNQLCAAGPERSITTTLPRYGGPQRRDFASRLGYRLSAPGRPRRPLPAFRLGPFCCRASATRCPWRRAALRSYGRGFRPQCRFRA